MAELEYTPPEYTPQEEDRFDHLTDVANMSAEDARRVIEDERKEQVHHSYEGTHLIGSEAAARIIQGPARENTDTPSRGIQIKPVRGRLRDGDSAEDPFWNGTAPIEIVEDSPEAQDARSKLLKQSQELAYAALIKSGLSDVEARAKLRAREEIRQRQR